MHRNVLDLEIMPTPQGAYSHASVLGSDTGILSGTVVPAAVSSEVPAAIATGVSRLRELADSLDMQLGYVRIFIDQSVAVGSWPDLSSAGLERVAATVVTVSLGRGAVEIDAEGGPDVQSLGTVVGLPIAIGTRVKDLLYLSGQLGLRPGETSLVSSSAEAQLRQIFDNFAQILDRAGLGLQDILKTTVYLRDLADFPAVNLVYGELFPTDPPARTTVGVHDLAFSAAIEVDAIVDAGQSV